MTTGGQFNSQRQARNELAETLSIMGIANQSKTSILNQIKKIEKLGGVVSKQIPDLPDNLKDEEDS